MPQHDLGSLRIHEGQRKSGGVAKKLGIAAAVIILAGLAIAGFIFRNQKPQVEVAVAHRTESGPAALLNASGYVTPRRRATIAAKITGRVTGVYFDEGTRVHEGQLLAKLDDSDVRRALDSAKADRNSAKAAITDFEVQLKNAQVELRRAQQLQTAGVQTEEQLDNTRTAADSLRAKISLAQAQVSAADARIEEAQQAVDNCTILAPFDGIVVSKDAQVGEMVSPISAGGGFTRTGIATIVDMKSNEIEVDVNEAYIARVRDGQHVTAILDAYPDWEIPSHVRTVIPTADRQKSTVKVRISFDKLDPRILPDMGIKVTFLGDQPKATPGSAAAQAETLVPQNAVRDEDGKKIVFVVKDDHLERRAVTVGNARGSEAAILAGVSAGDTVVTGGPATLHDGQIVDVRK
jgi:RND family efflux transporter MFP subunit